MFWSPFFTLTVIFVSFRKGGRERGGGDRQMDRQTDRQTDREAMNWVTFNHACVYVCVCDAQHSSVSAD